MAAMKRHWDIFCRVVDNFGDIGVCWRLARQLVAEHDLAVRLWVDEPDSLAPLAPDYEPLRDDQLVAGVKIRHWTEKVDFGLVADVVIEAFACELPPAYLEVMAQRTPAPRWINLEYLSAEPWIDDCHGMASPHPRLTLTKHFFFPGFSPASGGLLRESAALAAPENDIEPETLEISLFCYDNAPLAPLIEALAKQAQPVRCLVPPGKPQAAVSACLGGPGPWRCGTLAIEPLPFLAQDDYDRLLRRCAINFVRGEDSFLRAQWAGRPFVWQIYPQQDDAHRPKLDAFLDRYLADFEPGLAATVRTMFLAWNTGGDVGSAWPAFFAARRQIGEGTRHWSEKLAQPPDLAHALVNFCAARV